MRGPGIAAFVLGVVLAAPARMAQADEHQVIAVGFFGIQEPSRTAFDAPRLGPSITLGLFDDPNDTWRLRPGVALQFGTAFGPDGLWLGDVWLGYVATLGLTDEVANPFVSFGPTAAYVAAGDGGKGVSIGVRADLGIHGVLLSWLYWRAQVGFVAAGVGGLRSEVTVGHAFM